MLHTWAGRAALAMLLAGLLAACGFGAGEPPGLVEIPEAVTWKNGISALMAVYCNSCHGAEPSDSSLAYFRTDVYDDTGGAAGAYSLRQRLLERAQDASRPMPPAPARPMSAGEVAALRRWLERGAPYDDETTGPIGGAPTCTAGTTEACACGGGLTGEQVCRLDGTYTPCACEGQGSPSSPLDDVWRGIFQPTCVSTACHAAGAAYPDLETRAGLRERLLQASVQAPGLALVEPGFLDGSYLYQKVRDDFTALGIGSGNRMPTGAPLPAALRSALQTWIEAGAPE